MPIIDLVQPDLNQGIDTPKGFAVTPGKEDIDHGSDAAIRASETFAAGLAPAPTMDKVMDSALRQGNTVISAMFRESLSQDADPEFKPWEDIKGTPYEQHWKSFVDVRSKPAADVIRRRIDQENEDRKVLDSAPWYQSFPAQLLAGGFDLPSLVPGGTFVRGAHGGFSILKTGASVGAAAGVSSIAQETALHAMQETRPMSESAVNVGASVVLGGLLGAAGAKLLTNTEWAAAVRALEGDTSAPRRLPDGAEISPTTWEGGVDLALGHPIPQTAKKTLTINDEVVAELNLLKINDAPYIQSIQTFPDHKRKGYATALMDDLLREFPGQKITTSMQTDDGAAFFRAYGDGSLGRPLPESMIGGGSPTSAGAAAARPMDLEGNTIAGRAAGALAASTERLNPLLRTIQSPSPAVREISGQLVENSLYLNKNMQNVASDVAAETLMKEWNSGLVKAIQSTNAAHSDYVKAGGALRASEFRDAVGKAMRRNDTDPDPHVARVAQQWRSEVFDPLKKAAIEVGLLPADVSVETAASYFSRMWNRNILIAKEGEFKDIVTRYYAGAIGNEYNKASTSFSSRRAMLDQEISDLRLAGPERARLLETLPVQLDRLRHQNSAFENANRSVGEFHAQAFAAREAGKPEDAAQFLARAKTIADQAGEGYAGYVTNRNMLATRIKRIRNNAVGREEQVERLRNSIADGEVANVDRLRRVHRSLTLLESKMDSASPEVWQAELTKLRTDFAQTLERSTKAHDRLNTSIDKIREQAAVVDDGMPKASAVPTDFYTMLDQARQRVGSDPERKMAKRPVIELLKSMGGVDPTSIIGGELKHAGATARNAPGLYKSGGRRALDNLVADEHALFKGAGDERGHIRETDIVDAVRQELAGRPRRTMEEQAAIDAHGTKSENIDHYRSELESLGVDLEKMSNDNILKHLSAVQAERRFLADLESAPIPKGEGDYGAKAPDIVTKRDVELHARAERRTRLFESAEAKRTEQMTKLTERIGDLEKVDPEEAVRVLREALEARLGSTAGLIEREGQRIGWRLQAIEKADPKHVETRLKALERLKGDAERRFADRWEIRNLGQSLDSGRPDFTEAAKAIADQAHATLAGRAGNGSVRPEFMTVGTRGPMKDRTFNIPDNLVEQFLEHDVELVGRRYARVMGADVELARKFGSPDMVEQIGKVREDYARLRHGIDSEKELTKLGDAEKRDVRDIEALRDLLRGTRQVSPIEESYNRLTRAANQVNYIRSMGEVVLASITDAVRPAMVHGLSAYMGHIGQLATNLGAVKLSVAEAQLAGNVAERVLGHRLATVSEIIDPYASRGPVEAFLENMTNVASKWNGIRIWTDGMKSMAAVMTQNRILQNAEKFTSIRPQERAYLAYLGVDQSMAERIAAQFATHGETTGGVRVANTTEWTDPVAVRTYRAAMNKDVDSIIVQKSVADVPLFASTPTGRMLLQFKSFALASHQKVLLRGLQEDSSRFIGGTIAMTAMGMLITYLKAVSGNRPETQEKITKNPGWLVGEGLDRSGILAVPMEISNAFEKFAGVNPIKGPFKAFDPTSTQSQKNQNRNELGSLLGPTAGMVSDVLTVGGIPKAKADGKEVSQGQVRAGLNLLPYNSFAGIRQLLNYIVAPPQP